MRPAPAAQLDPLAPARAARATENMLATSVAVRELLNRAPSLGGGWGEAAQMALECGDEIAAREAAARLTEEMPRSRDAWMWLAAAEAALGRREAALQILTRQLMGAPNDGELNRRAGRVLLELGRTDEAHDRFHQALHVDPRDVLAWEGLMAAREVGPGDEALVELEQLRLSLGEADGPQARGIAAYALAAAYSKLGEHEVAARRVAEGAAFLREATAFDMDMHERSMERLLDTYDERFCGANEEAGLVDSRPVFIAAAPACGASWLAKALAADETVGMLERENALFWLSAAPLGDQTASEIAAALARSGRENVLAEVGRAYAGYACERFGRVRRWIDPSTVNELAGGAIGLSLPAARLIIVTREPRDAAWAIYAKRFRRARHWTYHPDEIARVLACHKRLVERWTTLFPERVLQVAYEDLCTRTEDEVRRIAFFAGVEADAAASAALAGVDALRADPPGAHARAGDRFAPVEAALHRAGLL